MVRTLLADGISAATKKRKLISRTSAQPLGSSKRVYPICHPELNITTGAQKTSDRLDGGQNKLILGTSRATQSEPTELQDALQVCEPHLDLLALMP